MQKKRKMKHVNGPRGFQSIRYQLALVTFQQICLLQDLQTKIEPLEIHQTPETSIGIRAQEMRTRTQTPRSLPELAFSIFSINKGEKKGVCERKGRWIEQTIGNEIIKSKPRNAEKS